MAHESRGTDAHGWLDAIGLPHILRVLEFTLDHNKLGIAALAIIANVCFGAVLDAVWTEGNGVESDAITQMIASTASNTAYTERSGTEGIFKVWSRHEQQSLLALMSLSPPDSTGPLDLRAVGMRPPAGAGRVQSLTGMALGVCWMARHHTLYFLLFAAGSLFIWSVAGGIICRLTALEFTQDEKPRLDEAIGYVKRTWFGGFFLAPCVPLVFSLVIFVLLVIGGLVFRIPLFGDVLAGGAFFLAILGGLVIAALIVGLAVGGSLFFPSVATDGADAFDAFSRSLSYAFGKPVKTFLYGLIATIYAAICWAVVRWFVFFGLGVTRAIVGVGTSPFGWWGRGTEDEPVSKMALVWPTSAADPVYDWPPEWSSLAWYECISSVLIGLWILLALALVWSFLATFYFSSCTVIYALLRRDVDGADLSDVYVEEHAGAAMEPDSAGGSSSPTISRISPPSPTEKPGTDGGDPPSPREGGDSGSDT